MAQRDSELLPKTYTVQFVLGGLVLIFVGLFVDGLYPDAATERRSLWLTIVVQLFVNVGIGVATGGVFSVLLTMRPWKEYFQDAVASIVVTHDYLKKLNAQQLDMLETAIAAQVFGAGMVEPEDSLYRHVCQKRNSLLRSPFRRNVFSVVAVTVKSDVKAELHEHLKYELYACDGRLPERIEYTLYDVDGQDVPWIVICVDVLPGAGAAEGIHREGGLVNQGTMPPLQVVVEPGKKIYALDISDVSKRNLRKISVSIETRISFSLGELQAWSMPHPTYGLRYTLQYDSSRLVGDMYPLGVASESCSLSDKPGLCDLVYHGWVFPSSGIAWLVRLKAGASENALAAAGASENAPAAAGASENAPAAAGASENAPAAAGASENAPAATGGA
nr:hypothetical protein MFMH1_13010 [Myxococcus sp. MH1]